MSSFSQFMRSNKKVKENVTYAVTKSIVDENGNPVPWTLRPISSKLNEELRGECTTEIPISGKRGMYRQKVNVEKYIQKLLVASCVEPDLYNEELQQSYGVQTPEDLLLAMVDAPGEYSDFVEFVQKYNGFDTSLEDKITEVKN